MCTSFIKGKKRGKEYAYFKARHFMYRLHLPHLLRNFGAALAREEKEASKNSSIRITCVCMGGGVSLIISKCKYGYVCMSLTWLTKYWNFWKKIWRSWDVTWTGSDEPLAMKSMFFSTCARTEGSTSSGSIRWYPCTSAIPIQVYIFCFILLNYFYISFLPNLVGTKRLWPPSTRT